MWEREREKSDAGSSDFLSARGDFTDMSFRSQSLGSHDYAPAWAGVATMWGVRLPLAWLLIYGLHFGATGAWWAMTVSTALNGLVALALFKRGTWKQSVV